MTHGFESDAVYLRSVVRLFPDYADTVVWFEPGPVDYDATKISSRLVADMRAWEQSYYDGLTDDFRWSSTMAEQLFAEEGLRIAATLSRELGGAFAVEVFDVDDATVRLRGHGRGENDAAVEAFRTMAQQAAEDEAQFAQSKRTGSWFAWSPGRGPHAKRAACAAGPTIEIPTDP